MFKTCLNPGIALGKTAKPEEFISRVAMKLESFAG
jgi:hypothetical protein